MVFCVFCRKLPHCWAPPLPCGRAGNQVAIQWPFAIEHVARQNVQVPSVGVGVGGEACSWALGCSVSLQLEYGARCSYCAWNITVAWP